MTSETEKRKRSALRFLLGTAGSGKTRHCLDRLLECEKAGTPALYLVPEQSTFLADRQILEPPGPEAIRHVRVVSFRRLAHYLGKGSATRRSETLDPAGRRILLRALIPALPEELSRPFDRLFDRTGFLENLATALRDLSFELDPDLQGGVVPAAGSGLDPPLRLKLRMIVELRELYKEALASRDLLDPDLLLAEVPTLIHADRSRFDRLPVLVDGFMSFTRLETEILVALVAYGARVTITLCLDPDLAERAGDLAPEPPAFRLRDWPSSFLSQVDRPVFLATLRTYLEVRSRFHLAGIGTRTETISPSRPNPRFHSPDLAGLESALLTRNTAPSLRPRDIERVTALDPAHEVEVWARQIDRWIRLDDQPVRPGEIAVIVRDLETYRSLVEETFGRFRIPIYIDRHWDITARPLVRTILDAIDLLLGAWRRDSVIAFLRSPLIGARDGEVDLLENLSLETGYDYERWTGDPWTPMRHPPRTRYLRGETLEAEEFDIESDLDDSIAAPDARIDRIEEVRIRIANRLRSSYLEPLRRLESTWKGGAVGGKAAVAALRRWIDIGDLREQAVALAADPEGEIRRELESIDSVLDRIAEELDKTPLTFERFARLLQAGLGSFQLGRTPTRLDCVTFADVQRSRLGEVRRAIVGGLSARDFPRSVPPQGIFNERERGELRASGLELGPPEVMRQEEEAYLFYIAVTRASERLLLTRPTADLVGGSLEPSPFLRDMLRFSPELEERAFDLAEDPADLREVQTTEELASRIGSYIASRLDRRRQARQSPGDESDTESDDRRILTAYNLLRGSHHGTAPERAFALEPSSRLWGYDNRPVLPETVLRTAHRGMLTSSAGRLESFTLCPYQHFARHMLRLERRPRSEITPLENGLLAHRALELLYSEGAPSPDRGEIERRLRELFVRIASEPDLRAYQVDPSGRFRMRSTRGQLLRYLELETKRLAESEFTPDSFERDFGTASVPPLTLTLPNGTEMLLRGRIDRIDSAPNREALILDYKSGDLTGRKRGRVIDVEDGFDLQLAVYLLVVEEVFGMQPVGALYVPVLPRPQTTLAKDATNPLGVKMVGLLPEDQTERVSGGLTVLKKTRGKKLSTREDLLLLLEQARETLTLVGGAIAGGRIDIAPVEVGGKRPCRHCDYAPVCRFDPSYNPVRHRPLDHIVPP